MFPPLYTICLLHSNCQECVLIFHDVSIRDRSDRFLKWKLGPSRPCLLTRTNAVPSPLHLRWFSLQRVLDFCCFLPDVLLNLAVYRDQRPTPLAAQIPRLQILGPSRSGLEGAHGINLQLSEKESFSRDHCTRSRKIYNGTSGTTQVLALR